MGGLKGFKKARAKRYGGVCSLKLIDVREVSEVLFDGITGTCSGIGLIDGAAFVQYEFREDSAYIAEKMIVRDGVSKTVQEITFTLPGTDSSSREALIEISHVSSAGILALVTTGCGKTLVVGASAELGLDKPLRFLSASVSSGTKPEDEPECKITLRCESKTPACQYKGTAL